MWCVCLLFRCMEGSGCPYHHDRYSDRPAVVHLRLRQGLLPPAPPPSPWDARVPEEEAWPDRVNPPPPSPLSHSLQPTHLNPQKFHNAHSSFLYLCPRFLLLCTELRAATYNVYLKREKTSKERRWSCRPWLSWVRQKIFLCRNTRLVLSVSVIRKLLKF